MIINCKKCDCDIHVNVLNWDSSKSLWLLCEKCQKIIVNS